MFQIADFKVESISVISDLMPKQNKFMNVEKLWDLGFKGEGIKVGVIDTGVTKHYCLDSNVKKGRNFTNDETDNYIDENGHGSNVASIIGAKPDGKNQGIYGVAPECDLYIAKALGRDGSGSMTAICNALEWLIEENVDIINMSLGSPSNNARLEELCKKAKDKDIVIVCAAGNEGDGNADTDEISYPAKINYTITVGAIDTNNNMQAFSNSNNELDCVAPGKNICGCYLNNKFASCSGTSQATPCVSGFLALLKQKFEYNKGRKCGEQELYAELIRHTVDLHLDYRQQGEGAIKYE